jgi:hypothetical protein
MLDITRLEGKASTTELPPVFTQGLHAFPLFKSLTTGFSSSLALHQLELVSTMSKPTPIHTPVNYQVYIIREVDLDEVDTKLLKPSQKLLESLKATKPTEDHAIKLKHALDAVTELEKCNQLMTLHHQWRLNGRHATHPPNDAGLDLKVRSNATYSLSTGPTFYRDGSICWCTTSETLQSSRT